MNKVSILMSLMVVIPVGVVLFATFKRKQAKEVTDAAAKETLEDEWSSLPENGLRESGFRLWRLILMADSSSETIWSYQNELHQQIAMQHRGSADLRLDSKTVTAKIDRENNFLGAVKNGSSPSVEFRTGNEILAEARVPNFQSGDFTSEYGGTKIFYLQQRTISLSGDVYTENGEVVGLCVVNASTTKHLFVFHPDFADTTAVLLMQLRFAELAYFKPLGSKFTM